MLYNKIILAMHSTQMYGIVQTPSVPFFRNNTNYFTSPSNASLNQFIQSPKNIPQKSMNGINFNIKSNLNSSYEAKRSFQKMNNPPQTQRQQQINVKIFEKSPNFSFAQQKLKLQFRRPLNNTQTRTNQSNSQLNNTFSKKQLSASEITENKKGYGVNDPQITQNTSQLNDDKIDYKQKIKNLENQLKFEERYANDLHKSSQLIEKQLSQTKQQNRAIKDCLEEKIKHITSIQDKISLLQQTLVQKQAIISENFATIDEIKQKLVEKENYINNSCQQLIFKTERVAQLQSIERRHEQTIKDLQVKISRFDEYYRNELYEQRVKQLSQQLCNSKSETSNLIMIKNKLTEELKHKNEKIQLLSMQSPKKSKEIAPRTMNEQANEVINSAFEQSIKMHLKDIQNLKNIVDNQEEIHKALRDETIDQKKVIQGLREEIRINQLKFNAEKRNLAQLGESRLIEKSNEINSLNNKVKMIEMKYSKALNQIKDKDTFLQQHLVGRTKDLELKQYIENTLKEYVATFQNRVDLQSKIKELQQQRLEILTGK